MATVMPTDVRLAVNEDRPAIIDLTTLLHGENGLFGRSEEKVQQMLDRYFERKGAIIGVIGAEAEPVAAIYMGIEQTAYSDDWSLVEHFNFVHPDHRHSNYAMQLLAYAKSVSDGMKLPLVTGILSNKRTEAKVRLYSRLLEPVGSFFLYNGQYSTAKAWDK